MRGLIGGSEPGVSSVACGRGRSRASIFFCSAEKLSRGVAMTASATRRPSTRKKWCTTTERIPITSVPNLERLPFIPTSFVLVRICVNLFPSAVEIFCLFVPPSRSSVGSCRPSRPTAPDSLGRQRRRTPDSPRQPRRKPIKNGTCRDLSGPKRVFFPHAPSRSATGHRSQRPKTQTSAQYFANFHQSTHCERDGAGLKEKEPRPFERGPHFTDPKPSWLIAGVRNPSR